MKLAPAKTSHLFPQELVQLGAEPHAHGLQQLLITAQAHQEVKPPVVSPKERVTGRKRQTRLVHSF